MATIEYSDRHKFLSSVGVALIVSSVLLPWLFLREPFDLLIKSEDLLKLTDIAREILIARQWLLSQSISLIPVASGFLFLTGLIFLIWGLFSWNKVQAVKDGIEILKMKALQMSEKQILDKQSVEAGNLQNENTSRNKMETIAFYSSTIPTKINSKTITKYAEIESRVIEQLKETSNKEYEVLSNRIIGNRSFDAILASNHKNLPDILVEVKYFNKQPSRNTIYKIYDRQMSVQQTYSQVTGRDAIGFVFLVLANDSPITKDLEELISSLDSGKDQKTVILNEDNISGIDTNRLYMDYLLS